jgi:hypothetical protein
VHRVANWEELIEFARQFSRLRYGGAAEGKAQLRRPG